MRPKKYCPRQLLSTLIPPLLCPKQVGWAHLSRIRDSAISGLGKNHSDSERDRGGRGEVAVGLSKGNNWRIIANNCVRLGEGSLRLSERVCSSGDRVTQLQQLQQHLETYNPSSSDTRIQFPPAPRPPNHIDPALAQFLISPPTDVIARFRPPDLDAIITRDTHKHTRLLNLARNPPPRPAPPAQRWAQPRHTPRDFGEPSRPRPLENVHRIGPYTDAR